MNKLSIHCDASCHNKDGHMGLGIACFKNDENKPFHIRSVNKHNRLGINNQAEYLAIINALNFLRRILNGWEKIEILSDSQIIINQLNGEFSIHNETLYELYREIHNILKSFQHASITFHWVPRENSRQKIADKLSKAANPYFIRKNHERVTCRTTKGL